MSGWNWGGEGGDGAVMVATLKGILKADFSTWNLTGKFRNMKIKPYFSTAWMHSVLEKEENIYIFLRLLQRWIWLGTFKL